MTFGLVDVSYSLPFRQAVKLNFFAPCRQDKFVQKIRKILFKLILKSDPLSMKMRLAYKTDFPWPFD